MCPRYNFRYNEYDCPFRCGSTFRILNWTYHVLWLVACNFGVYEDRVAYRRFSCNVSRRWWITFRHQRGGSLITWRSRLCEYFCQTSSRWKSWCENKMLVTVCVHQSYCITRYFFGAGTRWVSFRSIIRQMNLLLHIGFGTELCIDSLIFLHPKFHNIHTRHIIQIYFPDERLQLIYSNLTLQRIQHTCIRNTNCWILWSVICCLL